VSGFVPGPGVIQQDNVVCIFYTHFIYNQDRADVIKTTWALIQQLILFDKLPIGMHTKILTVMALTAVSKSQGNRRGG